MDFSTQFRDFEARGCLDPTGEKAKQYRAEYYYARSRSQATTSAAETARTWAPSRWTVEYPRGQTDLFGPGKQ